MKAKKVPRPSENTTFEHAVRRIVRVRTRELASFADRAADPASHRAQHDMRIAAKRVRYVLELGEPALGPAARDGAKTARELQDLLGDLHDCHVFTQQLEAHIADLRASDAAAALAAMPAGTRDLDPAALPDANATSYRGLERAIIYFAARRALLHRRFVRHWRSLEERGWREQIEARK